LVLCDISTTDGDWIKKIKTGLTNTTRAIDAQLLHINKMTKVLPTQRHPAAFCRARRASGHRTAGIPVGHKCVRYNRCALQSEMDGAHGMFCVQRHALARLP
jgi:hypothetical protein